MPAKNGKYITVDNFGKGIAVAGLNPGRAPKANGWGWRSIRPSRRVFNGGGSDPSNPSHHAPPLGGGSVDGVVGILNKETKQGD